MQKLREGETMLKLSSLGWRAKRIENELGCDRNTVQRYLRQGGWEPYDSVMRTSCLTQHEKWLAEQFRQHRGNCDVIRQELQRVHGVSISLRTIERAVAPLRRGRLVEGLATNR